MVLISRMRHKIHQNAFQLRFNSYILRTLNFVIFEKLWYIVIPRNFVYIDFSNSQNVFSSPLAYLVKYVNRTHDKVNVLALFSCPLIFVVCYFISSTILKFVFSFQYHQKVESHVYDTFLTRSIFTSISSLLSHFS